MLGPKLNWMLILLNSGFFQPEMFLLNQGSLKMRFGPHGQQVKQPVSLEKLISQRDEGNPSRPALAPRQARIAA
jgi:hypothetical protein